MRFNKSTTPILLQSKNGESGSVCLAMLLGYFGSFPNLTDIKIACDSGDDEIKPENLLKSAEEIGLDAELLEWPIAKLKDADSPLVIYGRNGKYFLLVRKRGNKYIVHEPEKGKLSLSVKELEDTYGGKLIKAKPGKDFKKTVHTPSFTEQILHRLKPYNKGTFYVLIAGVILLLPAIVIPTLSKLFFDDIIIQGQHSWFKPMLIVMASFLFLGSFLVYLQQKIMLQTELKMSLVESARFVAHILKVPYNYFLTHVAGDTVKRIKLNDAIAILLSRDSITMTISILTVFFYGLVMLKYSWLLSVVGISIMLLNTIAVKYFSAKRTALNQTLFQKQQATFSTATTGIEQIETLKASGSENDFFTLWSSHLVLAINDDQKLGITSRMLTVLPDFLSQLNNVIIVFLGGLLIIKGSITIGVFIAMQSFIANLADPIREVVNVSGNIQLNRSNLNNLTDTLDQPVDMLCETEGRDTVDTITPANARLSGKLEVKNISFGYSKFSPPLIENFSLEAFPGKHIAVVGSSGSGKSTLLKVLAGLYTVRSGDILYDGKPINQVNTDVLRNSLSIVDQDVFLFTGTIADNITMWNRAIHHKEIVNAAQDAVIHDIITKREDGYQARVSPGGDNFSGGQRQRIEIARSLVTSPSILFLDEATSALDTETEKQLIKNLKKRNCTTISIAHRLSTIVDSDEIIVLDHGKVLQRGTHDELMKQTDLLYYKLVNESA